MKSSIYFYETKNGDEVLCKLDCEGHYAQEYLAYMVFNEGHRPVENHVFIVYN